MQSSTAYFFVSRSLSYFSAHLKIATCYFTVDEVLESVVNEGDFDDVSEEDISDVENIDYSSCSEAECILNSPQGVNDLFLPHWALCPPTAVHLECKFIASDILKSIVDTARVLNL